MKGIKNKIRGRNNCLINDKFRAEENKTTSEQEANVNDDHKDGDANMENGRESELDE